MITVTYEDDTIETVTGNENGVATLSNRNMAEDITISIMDDNFFDIMDIPFNIHCESPPLEIVLEGKTRPF